MTKSKLLELINKVEVVSFDLYDTLISRLIPPQCVFDIVQEVYNKKNNSKICDFKINRINAERVARQNNNGLEITIEEIYESLEKQYLEKYDFDLLKKEEIEIEKECIVLNKEIYDIYRICKEAGKRIIITSDMYLDESTIKEILNANEIEYEELFLSSKIKFKKSNLSLYKHIIKKYKIKPSCFLHIGDNKKSDFINPRIMGMRSICVKNKRIDKLDYKKSFINNLWKIGYHTCEDSYFEFGYRCFGPLVYGYCDFLNNSIHKDKKIVFLAREGQFIKKAFELLTNRKSDYMYVSRKSVSSFLIKSPNIIDKNSIVDLQSISKVETIESFLKRFSLLNDKNIEILRRNNIGLKDYYMDYQNIIKNLFEKLIDNSNVDYSLFIQYLKQLCIDNNTVLVDIGWAGTMQDIIQLEINAIGVTIDGYYLGVRHRRKNIHKIGYLFDGEKNNKYEISSRSMVGLLELLFSATHGTTISYEKNENVINPILAPNDVSDEVMNYILKIQDGAIAFIKDFETNGLSKKINFSKDDYFYNLYCVGVNPSKKELEMFKSFQSYDENVVDLVGNKSIVYYFLHLKRFKHDFLKSTWKNAFLKNVFKLNINYYKIFEVLYKKEKRDS